MPRGGAIRGIVILLLEFFCVTFGAYTLAYYFTANFADEVNAQIGGFWAVATAIFVMHWSRRETYLRGASRLLGVLVGAAVGGAFLMFAPFWRSHCRRLGSRFGARLSDRIQRPLRASSRPRIDHGHGGQPDRQLRGSSPERDVADGRGGDWGARGGSRRLHHLPNIEATRGKGALEIARRPVGV